MTSSASFLKPKINGVLFDLDGTLLDTAPDLTAALNAVLLNQHHPSLPLASVRPAISKGATGLLKLGFNIADQDARLPNLRKQFIEYYNQHICEHTCLFPHIDKVIHYLQKNDVPWGIVTNKSTALTTKLLNYFPLLKTATCIIAGDTLEYSKPHPNPLLYACECISCVPKNCVYIGDAKRDIEAANAAKLYSLIALYGYIPSNEDVKSWRASGMVNTPLAILNWLKQQILR